MHWQSVLRFGYTYDMNFITFGRLAYLLTYLDILLNKWNIILPEKLSGSRIVKALLGFSGN